MEKKDLMKLVAENTYPGRGIVIGLTPDGQHAVIAYFIMGRSQNSRNRIFDCFAGGIRTEAADEAKLEDPSLIIYAPVRVLGSTVIVTNGDQTDTIYEHLQKGSTFEEALRTRTFEPDAPNWTPRISGLVTLDGGFAYRLAILKSADGCPDSTQRFFFEYPQPRAGEGHFLHTYKGDGNPIPSFEGEPVRVALCNDRAELAVNLWNSLHSENKVALYVRHIHLQTGKAEETIINRYDKVVHQDDTQA